MGFKKKLAYGLLQQAARHPNLRGFMKKAIIIAVVAGILLFILTISLISFGISQFNKIVSSHSFYEIAALERLVSEQQITLNEEQKRAMTPLLRQFGGEEQSNWDSDNISAQILALLDKKQLESVTVLVEQMKSEGTQLKDAGRSVVVDSISRYTGISVENGRLLIESLSWWLPFENSKTEAPQNLLREIESSGSN